LTSRSAFRFIYLLLSLLASAVQEAIAGLLAMRAATLGKGLRNMLEEETSAHPTATAEGSATETAPSLADQLYEHPLISAMYKKSWGGR
jgi:hypothetical protein